ncbi:MAG: LacI family transcriptional regulator [Sideroxydans sp.]|nr:LacI family transcriptional regulator [Sideroxydans sp.]
MATIKDVARLAGVGLGTASRVVSGKGSVSPSTAARVRRAIEQLEFRPSHAARSLLSGSSQMIGVYIPVLKGTFYTSILQVLDMGLRANGQHMVVAFGQGDGDPRQQAIEGIAFLIDRGCDGLVIICDALHDDDIVSMRTQQPNLVVLNHYYKVIKEQCFSADHKLGGKLAARTLLDQKHRRFAVIAGPSSSPDNVARISGFMSELEKNGINTTGVLIIESNYSSAGGREAAAMLLESKQKFTAVFCANDEMAIGALSKFQEAGIPVPGSISVLGYDDTQTAEFASPGLTSVHIPWDDVTLSGLYWLLNKCYGLALPVKRKYPISVTLRASVAFPQIRRRS